MPHPLVLNIHAASSREFLLSPGCRVARFDLKRESPEMLAWRPDGILAHLHSYETARELRALGIPVVNTSGFLENPGLPVVSPDNRAVGRLAADHLLRQGYARFAFVGNQTPAFSRHRLEGFREGLGAMANAVEVFEGPTPQPKWIERDEVDKVDAAFETWLMSLPPQTGVLAAEEGSAVAILDLLRLRDVDPLARFGILSSHDRDSPVRPALSAVSISSQRWGREAAGLLLRMIRAKTCDAPSIFFPPDGVVERESCGVAASVNRQVRAALLFIRDHADEDLLVTDVAEALGQSRRNLDRMFRRELGRTVNHEIQRAHVDQAKRLLLHGQSSVREIAVKAGVRDVNRFIRLFKAWEGVTPGEFRRRHRNE